MFKGLLNCDTRGQGGCKGGHVDQAWHFLRKSGSVDYTVVNKIKWKERQYEIILNLSLKLKNARVFKVYSLQVL